MSETSNEKIDRLASRVVDLEMENQTQARKIRALESIAYANNKMWEKASERASKTKDLLLNFPDSEGIFDESSSEGMPICRGLFYKYDDVEKWKNKLSKVLE